MQRKDRKLFEVSNVSVWLSDEGQFCMFVTEQSEIIACQNSDRVWGLSLFLTEQWIGENPSDVTIDGYTFTKAIEYLLTLSRKGSLVIEAYDRGVSSGLDVDSDEFDISPIASHVERSLMSEGAS